jgi:hypothetical protein
MPSGTKTARAQGYAKDDIVSPTPMLSGQSHSLDNNLALLRMLATHSGGLSKPASPTRRPILSYTIVDKVNVFALYKKIPISICHELLGPVKRRLRGAIKISLASVRFTTGVRRKITGSKSRRRSPIYGRFAGNGPMPWRRIIVDQETHCFEARTLGPVVETGPLRDFRSKSLPKLVLSSVLLGFR